MFTSSCGVYMTSILITSILITSMIHDLHINNFHDKILLLYYGQIYHSDSSSCNL